MSILHERVGSSANVASSSLPSAAASSVLPSTIVAPDLVTDDHRYDVVLERELPLVGSEVGKRIRVLLALLEVGVTAKDQMPSAHEGVPELVERTGSELSPIRDRREPAATARRGRSDHSAIET